MHNESFASWGVTVNYHGHDNAMFDKWTDHYAFQAYTNDDRHFKGPEKPNFVPKKLMAGLDASKVEHKDTIFASDSSTGHHPSYLRSMFVPDSRARAINKSELEAYMALTNENPNFEDPRTRRKNLKAESLRFEETMDEYTRFESPKLQIVPCSVLLGDSETKSADEAEMDEMDPLVSSAPSCKDGPITIEGVVYNFGELFFNNENEETKFKCVKDDKDRKAVGHFTRTMIQEKDQYFVLEKCREQFEQSKEADDEFFQSVIEATAYSKLLVQTRCLTAARKGKLLDTDPVTVPTDFWKLEDYLEQTGKTYLKSTKLAVVIRDPRTKQLTYIPYVIFNRYLSQLIAKSVVGKTWSCLNECEELTNVTKSKLEKHYEHQLVEAFVCTMKGCGRQFAYSSGYSAHFTTYHVKKETFDIVKEKVNERCESMKLENYNALGQSLDSKIVGNELNRIVELPHRQTPFSQNMNSCCPSPAIWSMDEPPTSILPAKLSLTTIEEIHEIDVTASEEESDDTRMDEDVDDDTESSDDMEHEHSCYRNQEAQIQGDGDN